MRLDKFDSRRGFTRGRPKWFEVIWYVVKCVFFLSAIPWPQRLRASLLRCFGAKVGVGLYMRPRVNIHLPWRLVIGDYCWIGEECDLECFEEVKLEDHVALAHRIFITSGNHDYKDHTHPYRHAPVCIRTGTWVASCAFIGPGVTIGEHNVIAAGAIVTKSTPDWMVMQGNPAVPVRKRVIER
jgi:putative colanic acid biosynthesis acetyltransferase WcaF